MVDAHLEDYYIDEVTREIVEQIKLKLFVRE